MAGSEPPIGRFAGLTGNGKGTLPAKYLAPTGDHPLVDAVFHQDDFVRFKCRISMHRAYCDSFEQGASRLLDEIGPRFHTLPTHQRNDHFVALFQCDNEDPILPDTFRGVVEFGVSVNHFPFNSGLPLMLAIASYVAAYTYVQEYQLLDIQLPERVARSNGLLGPRFGDALIPGTGKTRLGVILKPRFITDAGHLRDFVLDAGRAGVDYITDDELTVGNTELSFERRLEIVRECMTEVAKDTGATPMYFANILGNRKGAHRRAKLVEDLGMGGSLVNVYTMGYDLVSELRSSKSRAHGLVATGLGLGVLTRGPYFRVATELFARLSRLCGADAVYTGPISGLIESSHTSTHQLRRALTQPYGVGCKRPPAAAMMSGGVGLPELIQNDAAYGGPMFMSLGYEFAEARMSGISAKLLISTIRDIRSTVQLGGLEAGRELVERLASKDSEHRDCLAVVRAEEAVSR